MGVFLGGAGGGCWGCSNVLLGCLSGFLNCFGLLLGGSREFL